MTHQSSFSLDNDQAGVTRLTLFDRWALDFDATTAEDWFLEWVLRSPKQAGIHLTAGRMCYQVLANEEMKFDSALEVFGGIGGQTLIVEDLFQPVAHTVNEYNPHAVGALRSNIPEVVSCLQDAYDPDYEPDAELITLDFGDLTAWKTREGQPHRMLLDKTFSALPKAVLVTDIASRYLHLHRERYETLLGEGTCDTYEHYLEALAHRISQLYGYGMVVGYTHTWSTVMAFVRDWTSPIGFLPTPHYPDTIVVS